MATVVLRVIVEDALVVELVTKPNFFKINLLIKKKYYKIELLVVVVITVEVVDLLVEVLVVFGVEVLPLIKIIKKFNNKKR